MTHEILTNTIDARFHNSCCQNSDKDRTGQLVGAMAIDPFKDGIIVPKI